MRSKGLLNITRKEIKELLTPSTIVPVLVIALFFASMGNIMGGFQEEVEEKPVIGIVNEDSGEHSKTVMSVLEEKSEMVYNGTDRELGSKYVEEKGGTALLIIPENFSNKIDDGETGYIMVRWFMKGMGVMDTVSSGVVEGLIEEINREVSATLIERETHLPSSHLQRPILKEESTIIQERELEDISPSILGGLMSSQSIMIPIITMMLIMMAGGTIISSMGMEKEDKTLETLLTLPIKRSSIVVGKLVGAAVVGLIMALIYMLGFGFYMQTLEVSDMHLADYGLALSLSDYILVGISLFTALLAGLALSLLLGTFAKNYKSAQTLLFPVTALALIPMFVFMFTDIGNLPTVLQGVMYAIPFSHPIIAMRGLMFDNYTIVFGGILYSTIFSIVMIALVTKIFDSDKLVTGSMSKKGGLIDKLSR